MEEHFAVLPTRTAGQFDALITQKVVFLLPDGGKSFVRNSCFPVKPLQESQALKNLAAPPAHTPKHAFSILGLSSGNPSPKQRSNRLHLLRALLLFPCVGMRSLNQGTFPADLGFNPRPQPYRGSLPRAQAVQCSAQRAEGLLLRFSVSLKGL